MAKAIITIIILMGLTVSGFILYMLLGMQPKETPQPDINVGKPNTLTKEEAQQIAGNTKNCTMAGIPSHQDIFYNENTKTWWIDIERMPELENDGCNPACVISEVTKNVEVNWRCTGLIQN
ncbi:hypothetical protein KKA15_00855 [Patescibacteria group bacterium]|nr:hypothetical protein [Patescibacteria group bacterium]